MSASWCCGLSRVFGVARVLRQHSGLNSECVFQNTCFLPRNYRTRLQVAHFVATETRDAVPSKNELAAVEACVQILIASLEPTLASKHAQHILPCWSWSAFLEGHREERPILQAHLGHALNHGLVRLGTESQGISTCCAWKVQGSLSGAASRVAEVAL